MRQASGALHVLGGGLFYKITVDYVLLACYHQSRIYLLIDYLNL